MDETWSNRPAEGIARRSPSWCTRSATRSTRSPSGSCDSGLAEDALQNALVLAWRRLPHLREPDRFEAWIHRILVHACYDEAQRARHGSPTSASCPSTGYRPRTGATPSPTATNSSGRSAGSRSTSGRSSSCTTTSGCRSWRSPRCSRSPRVRPDRACTTPLADSATPSRPSRSPCPRRTPRMTDDRSLERAARSWIEAGPTQAPDRAVEAALLRIETTTGTGSGARPVEVARDEYPVRVAAAAVIGGLAIGGALFVLRPGTVGRRARPAPPTPKHRPPSPSPIVRSWMAPMIRPLCGGTLRLDFRSRSQEVTGASLLRRHSRRPTHPGAPTGLVGLLSTPITLTVPAGWARCRQRRLVQTRRVRVRVLLGRAGVGRGACSARGSVRLTMHRPRRTADPPMSRSCTERSTTLPTPSTTNALLDADHPRSPSSLGGYSQASTSTLELSADLIRLQCLLPHGSPASTPKGRATDGTSGYWMSIASDVVVQTTDYAGTSPAPGRPELEDDRGLEPDRTLIGRRHTVGRRTTTSIVASLPRTSSVRPPRRTPTCRPPRPRPR